MSLKISTALRDAEEKPAIAGSENREGISVYWTPTSGLIQAIYTRLISFNPPNNPRRQRLQLFPFNRSRNRSSAQGQGSPRSCGEQGKLSSLSSSNQAPHPWVGVLPLKLKQAALLQSQTPWDTLGTCDKDRVPACPRSPCSECPSYGEKAGVATQQDPAITP